MLDLRRLRLLSNNFRLDDSKLFICLHLLEQEVNLGMGYRPNNPKYSEAKVVILVAEIATS